MIRASNLPVLLLIALYERQQYSQTSIMETISDWIEKYIGGIPRRLKQAAGFENFGSKHDISLLFEIEREVGTFYRESEDDEDGDIQLPPPFDDNDDDDEATAMGTGTSTIMPDSAPFTSSPAKTTFSSPARPAFTQSAPSGPPAPQRVNGSAAAAVIGGGGPTHRRRNSSIYEPSPLARLFVSVPDDGPGGVRPRRQSMRASMSSRDFASHRSGVAGAGAGSGGSGSGPSSSAMATSYSISPSQSMGSTAARRQHSRNTSHPYASRATGQIMQPSIPSTIQEGKRTDSSSGSTPLGSPPRRIKSPGPNSNGVPFPTGVSSGNAETSEFGQMQGRRTRTRSAQSTQSAQVAGVEGERGGFGGGEAGERMEEPHRIEAARASEVGEMEEEEAGQATQTMRRLKGIEDRQKRIEQLLSALVEGKGFRTGRMTCLISFECSRPTLYPHFRA